MMQALRFHGQRDIRLDQVPIPTCGKGQVKVKPAFVGICGTDLHEYMGGASIMPTIAHPITKEKVPLTVGHEFSGYIEEVGEDIHDIKVGARVTIMPIIYDGTCGACQDGYINCCDSNGFVGLSGWGGGLSEHCVVPRKAVYEVADSVPMEVAALVEPLAVGWHAVDVSPFKETDTVLILGGGPIGLAVIHALKAKGAKKIIVSEVAPRRKEFARQFGADYVLDPTKEDIVAKVKEICGGVGVNVAFDAAGVQAGLDTAILAIRARGTLVNIAIWEKTATLVPNQLVFRERKYMGVATFLDSDFKGVIKALESGAMKPEGMITKKIRLNEVEEEGYKTLINDKNNHVKILIEMNP